MNQSDSFSINVNVTLFDRTSAESQKVFSLSIDTISSNTEKIKAAAPSGFVPNVYASAINPPLPVNPATEASSEASTAASTEASTLASTEASTQAFTEASTAASTEASTQASTEASTAASTEASTQASTEASTAASTRASTAAFTDSNTATYLSEYFQNF
ncbi:MAG: hypothetical protein ACK5PO_05390 [Bacteroidota bacterium]